MGASVNGLNSMVGNGVGLGVGSGVVGARVGDCVNVQINSCSGR